jgi:hypothetical protein
MADVFRFPPTPSAPPPKNIHRATFFTVIGPSGRPLTCAAFDVDTGLELRLSYADDDVMRSELFRSVDADEQLVAKADAWRLTLLQKGFRGRWSRESIALARAMRGPADARTEQPSTSCLAVHGVVYRSAESNWFLNQRNGPEARCCPLH